MDGGWRTPAHAASSRHVFTVARKSVNRHDSRSQRPFVTSTLLEPPASAISAATPTRALRIAALIPAYKEERFITDVVQRTRQQLGDVLVVDDGSGDRTGELARAAGAEVIRHETNKGKGAAIQTGFKKLCLRGFDYVLILDADGQHRPEEIPRFLDAAARERTKMLVGNRMHDTADMPWNRRWANQFMSTQISLLCGQRVNDTQCGFRMIHRDLIPRLSGLRASHFQYETEMLILASWRGEKISAVPISTVYGEETSSIHPGRDALRFFALMARYWVKRAGWR